jgi:hypothetical protein
LKLDESVCRRMAALRWKPILTSFLPCLATNVLRCERCYTSSARSGEGFTLEALGLHGQP